MPCPTRLLVCLSFGLLLACGSNNTASGIPDSVTLIAVDPADFPVAAGGDAGSSAAGAAGAAPICGSLLGSGSYVAELVDVSGLLARETGPDIMEFTVQSSPPTACDRTVAFGRVVPNREYIVRVKTYRESAVEICTCGGTSVTVTRASGECSATQCSGTLAQPLATLTCFGWQTESNASGDTSGAAGAEGAARGCDSAARGCPGIAIQYRTVTLHYCAESMN